VAVFGLGALPGSVLNTSVCLLLRPGETSTPTRRHGDIEFTGLDLCDGGLGCFGSGTIRLGATQAGTLTLAPRGPVHFA